MPDKYGFEHLPHWGSIRHRCIEEGCNFPAPLRTVSERERRTHFRMHERERERELERKRKKSLARARQVKRMKEREEAQIKERFGEEPGKENP